MKIHSPTREPPGRAVGLVGTLVVHAAAVAFLVTTVKPSKASPPSYAVNLVAAPAPSTKRLAREALPTPPPEEKPPPSPPKPTPVKEKPAPIAPKPPKPAKTTPAPAPQPPPTEADREPAPKTASQAAPAPGETPSTGTDVATIKTPGLAFPYPEYLRNIVTQVYQRWDRSSAREDHFAEISFLILRDGTVRDIRFVTRSGSFAFDLDAQGAVEAAGNNRAFGQLPDGYENRRSAGELLLQAHAMTKFFLLLSTLACAGTLAAQDTTRVDEGVRVGVDYTPGVRPGLVVLPGRGIDSVRAIIRRDLDYTDRFEMITVAEAPDIAGTPGGQARGTSSNGGSVNYDLYRQLGAEFAVELHEAGGGTGSPPGCTTSPRGGCATRSRLLSPLARTSDSMPTGWPTRLPAGPAERRELRRPHAVRCSGGRIYRADSDGHDVVPLTPAGQTALSPVWSPDGQRIAFTLLGEGRGGVIVQTLSSGSLARGAGDPDRAQHHAGVLARRQDPGFRPLRRAGYRYLHRERGGALLRATLDRGTLRGQLKPNVFTRWAAHRVYFHACRAASVVCNGSGRNRSGAAGVVRLWRHRKFQRSRVVSGRCECSVPSRSFRQPPDLPG